MQERALKFNLRGFLSLLLGVGICKKFGTHCFLSFHTHIQGLHQISLFQSRTLRHTHCKHLYTYSLNIYLVYVFRLCLFGFIPMLSQILPLTDMLQVQVTFHMEAFFHPMSSKNLCFLLDILRHLPHHLMDMNHHLP